MSTRNLVMNDNQLSEKIVTESHQNIELGQLEAEIATYQESVDSLSPYPARNLNCIGRQCDERYHAEYGSWHDEHR